MVPDNEGIAAGRRLGRYVLYESIARGGMASVHFGRMLGLVGFTRTVAIKRLHPHLARDPEFVAMFLDEARVAARIHHPNVVSTLDIVTTADEVFLVMEYVRGEVLSGLVKRGVAAPQPVICSIIAGVLHGLHAAHEAKSDRGAPLEIVHRDVSPQNILVGEDGVARIADFGVAKATWQVQTTRDGQLKGKVAYMAPEQLRRRGVDRRTDLYAIAVVLWEALTSRRLFAGDDPGSIIAQVLMDEVPPPSVYAPSVSRELDAFVLRGLAHDPNERFATAAEMAKELERLVPLAPQSSVSDWVRCNASEALTRRAVLLGHIEAASVDEGAPLAPVAPPAVGTESAIRRISDAPTFPDSPAMDPMDGLNVLDLSLDRGSQLSGLTLPDDGARPLEANGASASTPRSPDRRGLAVAALALASISLAVTVARSRPGHGAAGIGPASAVQAMNAPPSSGSPALHVSNVRRITFGDGCQEFPSFVPDGQTLVYDDTVGPNSYIFEMPAEGGDPRPLTRVRGWDYAASVSPDGAEVAFLREAQGAAGTFVVGIDGGEPRPLSPGTVRPSWSGQGQSIWAGSGERFTRYDATTGSPQESVAVQAGYVGMHASELPDGSLVTLLSRTNVGSVEGAALLVFGSTRTRKARWLVREDLIQEAIAVMPDGQNVLVGRMNAMGQADVVDLPVDGSSPATLPASGVAPYKGLSMSRDGRHLVWSTCRPRGTLKRLDKGVATPLYPGGDWNDHAFSWLSGTNRLVALSSRGGSVEAWLIDLGAQNPPRRLELPWEPRTVASSPDGRTVVLDGTQGIATLAVDGRDEPRALTDNATDFSPSLRRDGATVLFSRPGEGGTRVMEVPVLGGEARPFLDPGSQHAVESPVEDVIVFLAGDAQDSLTPMLYYPRTGQRRPLSPQLSPGQYITVQFSPDGSRVATTRAGQQIFEVDVLTGAIVRTLDGADEFVWVGYVRNDLIAAVRRWTGNLWTADIDRRMLYGRM
jgi:serine/threonine protein kinase/Tol biopolymer transport system component